MFGRKGGEGGGRLSGLCVFCTMLRSSSSYSINPLCILVEKNIKHMKIYLWEKSVFGCVKVLSVKNIMVSNSVWLVRANPNERKKRKKERSMEGGTWFPLWERKSGATYKVMCCVCLTFFLLFFRSFRFARTNQTVLEIIMFLTLSTLTYSKTDFSHK